MQLHRSGEDQRSSVRAIGHREVVAIGHHGLWASMHLFNVARAITLLARFPALERGSFQSAARI